MSREHRAKKSLGQNFLVDRTLQRRIVEAIEPQADDVVLEIGPGQGALTRHLAGTVRRLILVELDDSLAAALADEFAGRNDVTVVHADFMQLDLRQVCDDPRRLKVIGNIPYNITSPIIFRLLERELRPQLIVLMIQKEVADRILAPPGDGTYGALSVGVRAVARAQRLFHVPRGAFRPVPKVDSTVLRIEPLLPPPLTPDEERDLRSLTRVAFSMRRKQLQKILRSAPEYGLDPDAVARASEETGIGLVQRPESLPPDEFITLSRALRALGRPVHEQQPNHILQREWLAALAHELRSPLSAILGYGELLAEGALGPLEPRALDAINRSRLAADQLLRLIEAIEELFSPAVGGTDTFASFSARGAMDAVGETLRSDAEARGATLLIEGADIELYSSENDVRRCLLLALAAALKASPGATLRLHATAGPPPAILLDGADLEPERDDPEHGHAAAVSGAGLRISLARRSARLAGGDLTLFATPVGTRLRIELPRARLD
jgi:16S rRNA (adenine1518-N6/adenine1519-N6)-dimethyltransferase